MDMIEEDEPRLTYEDIIPYLPPDITDVDQSPDIIQFLKDWKERTQRRYVSRVNYLYNQFRDVWPGGTPIEYYIAYVHYSSKSEDELFEKLKKPKTIRKILKIVAEKNMISNSSTLNEQSSERANDDDDINEETFNDDSHVSKKKKSSNWTENEISTFIKLLSKKNNLKTWENVSDHFKNKTKNDCYQLYQKLHRKGRLSSKYVPKKEISSSENDDYDITYDRIKGIFLEFNSIHSIVGPNLASRKEIARYNPLYGHIDLITGERMFLPTISEYGTVLDYSSWLKIISDTHLDPYEIKPINTVRQITVITWDNYTEIKEKIKHIGKKCD